MELNQTPKQTLCTIEKWTMQGAHMWYEQANSAAVERYGAQASTFLRMAAALSQRRKVGDDIRHAAWALSNPSKDVGAMPYRKHGISSAFSASCEQARLIRDGLKEHANGPKIGAFSRALVLDASLMVAVCDVHVCAPLVGARSPNDRQREAITARLLACGRLLWPALDAASCIRRAQAAFWHESASTFEDRTIEQLSYAALIRKLPTF